MSSHPFGFSWRRPTNGHAWSPAIELIDNVESYRVGAELPGVAREDVEITLSQNVLTIKGETKRSAEVRDEDIQYSEMTYGSFSRSFTLPTK